LASPKENLTFVSVQPKLDRKALTPPPNASPSDMDRQAQTREKPPPKPENNQPFSRGNTPEMVDSALQRQQAARGQGPQPDPQIGEQAKNPDASKMPDSQTAMPFPSNRTPSQSGANGVRPQQEARSAMRCATCSATRKARRSIIRAARAVRS